MRRREFIALMGAMRMMKAENEAGTPKGANTFYPFVAVVGANVRSGTLRSSKVLSMKLPGMRGRLYLGRMPTPGEAVLDDRLRPSGARGRRRTADPKLPIVPGYVIVTGWRLCQRAPSASRIPAFLAEH
jgi:hypothetical protein